MGQRQAHDPPGLLPQAEGREALGIRIADDDQLLSGDDPEATRANTRKERLVSLSGDAPKGDVCRSGGPCEMPVSSRGAGD